MKRTKVSLPLTRFVAPKKLGHPSTVLKIDTPTSSPTPVDHDGKFKEVPREDEGLQEPPAEVAEENEMESTATAIAEAEVTTSIGPTAEDIADKTVEALPEPIAVLEAVRLLQQGYLKHQDQLITFVNEANSRILKLEQMIQNTEEADVQKCQESLQELKTLMADTYKPSTKTYVSALSFTDFDNQQSRTRSNLSRFTQLDSGDDSSPATIDPSVLQPSRLCQQDRSPITSPGSSSIIQPSSQIQQPTDGISLDQREEQCPGPPHAENEATTSTPKPAEILNSDVEDIGSDSPIASPHSSPYRPSCSATSPAHNLPEARSEHVERSPLVSFPVSRSTERADPAQHIPSATSSQILQDTQSTSLTQPTATPPGMPTNTSTHPKASKRPRRTATVPSRPKPDLPPPPAKKQKGQKGTKKSIARKQSVGPQGSLPKGTLKKSSGVARVKDAVWPKSGPNTVIGLGGSIECEVCFGPVHRSCAGLMDNEEIPNMTWICPECDHIRENGGQELGRVEDTEHCIRPNCIRRANKKLEWKATDAELFVILQAIGRRPLQPARSFLKGQYEYLTLWKGYPLTESTWEPIESFIAAQEMVRQFDQAAEEEGWDLESMGDGVVLLQEAMGAFGQDGELRI